MVSRKYFNFFQKMLISGSGSGVSGKPQKPFAGPGIQAAKAYFSEEKRVSRDHGISAGVSQAEVRSMGN